MKMWMVTGGTSGLGADILRCAPKPAYRVGGRRLEERENAVVYDVCCEFEQVEQAVSIIEQAIHCTGYRPSVLINCAGANLICRSENLVVNQLERIFKVNVFMPLLLTARLIYHELLTDDAVVVNIGSSAALRAGGFSAAYVASKHALTGVTRSLAKDYGKRIGIYQINFGKLGGTEMSDYIDKTQAALRGTSVAEERARQQRSWRDNREIPLRAASQFVLSMVEDKFFGVENGEAVHYEC